MHFYLVTVVCVMYHSVNVMPALGKDLCQLVTRFDVIIWAKYAFKTGVWPILVVICCGIIWFCFLIQCNIYMCLWVILKLEANQKLVKLYFFDSSLMPWIFHKSVKGSEPSHRRKQSFVTVTRVEKWRIL